MKKASDILLVTCVATSPMLAHCYARQEANYAEQPLFSCKQPMDKNFFYDDTQIVEGFSPAKTKQVLNNKGEVTTIICHNKKFKLYLVEHDK